MNCSSEWKRTAMAAPTVSLFPFRIKWKFVWPIQSVLKVYQTLRCNEWNCVINFHPHHRVYCGLYMLHAHVHRIVCMLQALFYYHATPCSRFVYVQWLWQSNMYVKIKSLFLLSCTHVLSTYQWFFAPLFRLIFCPFSSRKCRKTISLFTVL